MFKNTFVKKRDKNHELNEFAFYEDLGLSVNRQQIAN